MDVTSIRTQELVRARHPARGNQTLELHSLEYSTLSPTSGEPLQGSVDLEYTPDKLEVDETSVRAYLSHFRELAISCEAISAAMADDLATALAAHELTVTVTQSPRGGIIVKATSRRSRP